MGIFNFCKKVEEIDKVNEEKRRNNEVETQNGTVEIDFVAIEAVSIERVYKQEWIEGPLIGKTIIGYMRGNKSGINEWVLKCSIEEHEKLAEQFREYMKKKYELE